MIDDWLEIKLKEPPKTKHTPRWHVTNWIKSLKDDRFSRRVKLEGQNFGRCSSRIGDAIGDRTTQYTNKTTKICDNRAVLSVQD